MQRHIQTVSSQARFEFGVSVEKLIESLQEQLSDLIDNRMRRRQAELAAAIIEARKHQSESEQVRAPQRAACDQVLDRLRVLSGRAGQLAALPA